MNTEPRNFGAMFMLPFHIPESPVKMNLKDPIFSTGSCFSENIGEQLAGHKFEILSNPFGVIYNPYSLFKNLQQALAEGPDPDDLIENEGIFYHWDVHSTLSGTDPESVSALIKKKSQESKAMLMRARWLILSPGTTYVYRYRKTGRIVANCHKVPQKEFEKFTLTADEITKAYFEMLDILLQVNPGIQVILTVSPVRHVRDGLVENNISKGTLLQAVRTITSGTSSRTSSRTKSENTWYFPSYELMIDVLRDYRFYKADMVHPNEQAVQYIWERFAETFMDRDTRDFIVQWEKIRRSLQHRPFHPASDAHQRFLRSVIRSLKALEDQIDVSAELKQLEQQLTGS